MTNIHPDARRRKTLLMLGAAGAGMLSRSATSQTPPACVVTPEQTEGPDFVDARLNRSDIRSDPSDNSIRPGVPLSLTLRVAAVGAACAPLTGAIVDIWHCDAAGAYSDTASEGTAGKKFLRGYQLTDANGEVRFTTIYPGWYPGRATHIHFKVRTAGKATGGRSLEVTSQLYFDDALTDKIMSLAPYSARDNRRRLRNERDGIFRDGGSRLMLPVNAAQAGGEKSGGYTTAFHIGLKI